MLELIIMTGVIAWFARTAKSKERSGALWGFIGAVSYYVPVLIIGRVVYPELVKGQIRSDNVIQYMVLGLVLTIGVGIASCLLARIVLLSKGGTTLPAAGTARIRHAESSGESLSPRHESGEIPFTRTTGSEEGL